jgi:hypothetical protein
MEELEMYVLAIYSTLPKSQWIASIKADKALVTQGVPLDPKTWPVSVLKVQAMSVITVYVENDDWRGNIALGTQELESLGYKWFNLVLTSQGSSTSIDAEVLLSINTTDSKDAQIQSLKDQLAEAQASLMTLSQSSSSRKRGEKRVCRACVGRQRDEELLIKLHQLTKENDDIRRSLSKAWKENVVKDNEIRNLRAELTLNVLSSEATLNLSAIDINQNTSFKDFTIEVGELTNSVDDLVKKFLRENPTKQAFTKIEEGYYKVGRHKIAIKLHEGQLCAQVCGGMLSLHEFLKVNSKLQTLKARQSSEGPLTDRPSVVPMLNLHDDKAQTRQNRCRSISTFKSPRMSAKPIEPVLKKTTSKVSRRFK